MARETDFSYSDLPKTRIESAIYQLKYRKETLIKILLLMIPFALPFAFFTIYGRYFFLKGKDIVSHVILINIPNIFLIFLLGVGIAGMFYSLRRLIFHDTVKISYHFFKGIKESGFEFGLFSSIGYILYIGLDIIDKLIYKNAINIYPLVTILIMALDIFIAFIIIGMMASASLYVVSFNQALRDSMSLISRGFKKVFPIFLLYYLPMVLVYPYMALSFSMYLNIIGFALSIVITFYFGSINILSTIYDEFDYLINKTQYPDYYKKGVYRDEA